MCMFNCEARKRSGLKMKHRNSCADLEELETISSETVLPPEYNVPMDPVSEDKTKKAN